MAKEKGTIDYPVSTRYRSNWGQWEAVREIVQNAIDTKTRVRMEHAGGKLVIRDRGEGFSLRNLIIGEGTKDGVGSIGKFGEGMKFALLALLRKGCTVRMQTNGTVIIPRLSEMFDVETLSIDWHNVGVHIKGTKVEITGVSHDYRGRFLSLRYVDNVKERVLMDKGHRGKLFIKGIYVKKIEAVAGYNLNLERENPMSGDVEMSTVKDRVARVMRATKDRTYISRVVEILEKEELRGTIEAECGRFAFTGRKMKHHVMWREEVKAQYGDQVCKVTNLDAAREAQYKGYRTISTDVPFAAAILKTDTVVAPLRKDHDRKRVSKKQIGTKARANVKWAQKLVEDAMKVKIAEVRIIEFSSGTQGEGKYRSHISLSAGIVADRQSTLETMMHEFVHYHYGYGDLTHEFQEAIGVVAAKVAMHLAAGPAPKAKAAKVGPSKETVRMTWIGIYEHACEKDVEGLKGQLHWENMNQLARIASAFGVNPFGQKKGPLVMMIADVIAYWKSK